MSKNANWQSTIDIVVGILDRHKVIMRNDAIFDRQAKEDLAADIIEKLDDIWHTDKPQARIDEWNNIHTKHEVGTVVGNYSITERFRKVGKNTKFKVVCTLCGAPMFRYSNKFKLPHKDCPAIICNRLAEPEDTKQK